MLHYGKKIQPNFQEEKRMIRKISLTVMVAVLMLVAVQAFAEYDRPVVVDAMRMNGKAMGQLNKSIQDKDFFGIADAFFKLAVSSNTIKDFTPPKGSAEQWKEIHTSLVKAAFRGIGAVSAEDLDGIQKAFGEIRAFNNQGHGAFK